MPIIRRAARLGFELLATTQDILPRGLFTGEGEIIKPSEHGLGPYFHPNKTRYVPPTCLNQKDSYPQWMVDGWRWILANQLGPKQRPPDWFNFAAMRQVAITTPNVLARLRRY